MSLPFSFIICSLILHIFIGEKQSYSGLILILKETNIEKQQLLFVFFLHVQTMVIFFSYTEIAFYLCTMDNAGSPLKITPSKKERGLAVTYHLVSFAKRPKILN